MERRDDTLYKRGARRLRRESTRIWYVHLLPRLERHREFELDGRRFVYLNHPSHETWRTERAVELPVAEAVIRATPDESRVLEVGNVLAQYFAPILPASYLVVDKYESAAHVENLDVLQITGHFDLIISISTLEHVGLDEQPRDWAKARRAVEHLRSLMSPNGRMLMTWALSYNRDLDDALREGSLNATSVSYLKRKPTRNKWFQASADDAFTVMYGWPNVCGNAIAVVEWRAPPI